MRTAKKKRSQIAPTLWLTLDLLLVAIQVLAGAQEERPRRVQQPPAQPQKTPQKEKPQKDPEEAGEAIKISSNLVTVPVSVTDSDGEPVKNLKAHDFKLEEEGEAQQVTPVSYTHLRAHETPEHLV